MHSPYPASQAAAICVGKMKSFPCHREGKKQGRPALQSTAHCFEKMEGGTTIWPSQIVTASLTVISGHSLGFHRKQQDRYQLCCSVIFSNRWSSSPPGTGTGGTDIWAMTLQFSRTTCLSLSIYIWKKPPALHVPEAGSVTLRAHVALSTRTHI